MRFSRFVLALASVVLAAAQAFGGSLAGFQTTVPYQTGVIGANFVVAADVNGDGFPDIVVATNNGVTVMLNNGNGTFGAPSLDVGGDYATWGVSSESVAVADVNGDGLPDIVVTNYCAQTPTGCYGIAVLLGNGDGTFQAAIGYDTAGLATGAVVVGDVNGDGFPDLVVTNECQVYTCAGGSLKLLLNHGDGTFARGTEISDSKGPVAIGTMTNDGNLDLVTPAGVMLGNGDGTFQPANGLVVAGANSITLADVNNDGHLDVVVTLTKTVAVQLGNGDGTLQSANTFKTGGLNPLWVAVADVNGDNNPDLAVANECSVLTGGTCGGAPSVAILAGKGDGTFYSPVTFATGGYIATSVAVADVNQDSKIDLVVSNACAGPAPADCGSGSVGVLINNFIASTTTKVMSSLNPSVLGQSVTFTATVGWQYGFVPTGEMVNFSSGTSFLGSAPLNSSGLAVFTTSTLPGGTHTIKAAYVGDAYFNPSSSSVSQVVEPYSTSTTVSSNPTPSSNYGEPVTLMAVVSCISSTCNGHIPTGKVTFKNGTTTIGTSTLDPTGTATLNTSTLPLGMVSLKASYTGDSEDSTSTSTGVVVLTVNQAQIMMALSSTPNPSGSGKTVTFTATLTSNGGLPTGQPVTFSYNGKELGTADVSASGLAVFSTKTLPSGPDVVTATYAGNLHYSEASAQTTQNVN